MKKSICLLFAAVFILVTAVGCTDRKTVSEPPITINFPTDNTVNGYRTGETSSTAMPETVEISDVEAGKPNEEKDTFEYVGNKKTKTLHKNDCSVLKRTKQENLVEISDRNEAISDGYKPCKRCNP